MLLDLSLDHFEKHFLVLRVDTTCAFAPATGIRASLLCLAAVTAQTGDGLGHVLLIHQVRILLLKLFHNILEIWIKEKNRKLN